MAKNSKEVQQRADEKRRGQRTRNWNVIVYPESAPADWRDILDTEGIQWVESPLHDKDKNPTGELKKAHWHILLLFSSVKTLEQVKGLTDRLNAPNPMMCSSAQGSVRYMAHLDNPEKYQYDKADIKAHGGADLTTLMAPSNAEARAIVKDITAFILENQVSELTDLIAYCLMNDKTEWFNVITEMRTLYICNLLKSQRHSGRKAADIVSGQIFGEAAEPSADR